MLKKLLGCTGTLVAVLWLAGAANASSLTFTDVVNPEPDILIGIRRPVYTYTHSILDDGFVPGQHLHAALLTIDVRDDASADKRERVTVDVDGHNYGTFVITGADLHLTLDTTLLDDGLLNVTLTRSKGDFLFRESALTAQAPEPSTLLLLGSGLVGLVGVSLRRRQKGASA